MAKIVIIKTSDGKVYRGPITTLEDYTDIRANDRYIQFVHDEKSAARTGDSGYLKEVYDREHQKVVDVQIVDE